MGKLSRTVWFSLGIAPAAVVLILGWGFFSHRLSALAKPSTIPTQPLRQVTTRTYAGFSQIVLNDTKEETFLTDDRFNNTQPHLEGNFIVWLRELSEETQIVLYEIDKRELRTIQSGRKLLFPKVSEQGKVVWQRWENDNWYLSYFDGQQSHDTPQVGIYPNIYDDQIIFARRSITQEWELVLLTLSTNQETVLAVDPSVKQAWIDGDMVRFPNGLIPLVPSPTPAPVETTPPRIIDPETTPNEPDMQPGEPSRIPPGDERLLLGEEQSPEEPH